MSNFFLPVVWRFAELQDAFKAGLDMAKLLVIEGIAIFEVENQNFGTEKLQSKVTMWLCIAALVYID